MIMGDETEKKYVCAAFCGTGKSYLCNKFADRFIEFECWEYREGQFPENYVKDIKVAMGTYDVVFSSTDPVALKKLNEIGIPIKLVYPRNELKIEYFERFKQRGSHIDFVNAIDRYWDVWLDELKEQNYCEHVVLKNKEYLQDVILVGNILRG